MRRLIALAIAAVALAACTPPPPSQPAPTTTTEPQVVCQSLDCPPVTHRGPGDRFNR